MNLVCVCVCLSVCFPQVPASCFWPKVGLEPKFPEAGTFRGFGKREQTNKQTGRQDSCFISKDIALIVLYLGYSVLTA